MQETIPANDGAAGVSGGSGGFSTMRPSAVWLGLRREPGHASIRTIVRQVRPATACASRGSSPAGCTRLTPSHCPSRSQSLVALATLHARNITHRDLKPPNLILRVSAASPASAAAGLATAAVPPLPAAMRPDVRLADFGSAVDDEVTRPHGLGMYPDGGPTVGEETEGYQPPEAALGGEAYAVARPCSYDLWSMGIVILELLLGTPHVLPLSRRAEAVLRLKYSSQPPAVMSRLLAANALAEHCILPAAAASDPAAVSRYGRKGAACSKAEFVSRVLASDPLREILSLAEAPRLLELIDLAWLLLRWRPEERLSASQALLHPALLELTAAPKVGGDADSAARPWWAWKALLEHPRLSAPAAPAAPAAPTAPAAPAAGPQRPQRLPHDVATNRKSLYPL